MGTTRSGHALTKPLTIRFTDFWPGFDPKAYFLPLLRSLPLDRAIQIADGGRVDVEVHSVFTSRSKAIVARLQRRLQRVTHGRLDTAAKPEASAEPREKRIWFTGENIRPPLGAWDATLSFDSDSEYERNAYFPLWWQLFPELIGDGSEARPGLVPVSQYQPLETFLFPRDGQAGSRRKFACAIISNPEPTRMRAIQALQSLGEVDVFGRVSGKPVRDKFDVALEYQFVLCFENDVYPGYVTEKVFDAWSAGAIPLWWGMDRDGYVNPLAVINLAECGSMDGFLNEVARLQANQTMRDEVSSQPLLLKRPDLGTVRDVLFETLRDLD